MEKAEAALRAYRRLRTAATVELKSNTHLVDIPRMLIDAADEAGVKITIDFSLVYKELRDEARDNPRDKNSEAHPTAHLERW